MSQQPLPPPIQSRESSLPSPRVVWPPPGSRRHSSNKTRWIIVGVVGGATVMLALGVLVVTLVVMRSAARRQSNREALAQIERAHDQMRSAALQQIESEGFYEGSPSDFENYLNTLEQSLPQLTGPEKVTAQAGLIAMGQVRDPLNAYDQKVQEFEILGGIDPTGMHSVANIEARLDGIRRAKQAGQNLTAALRKLPDQFRIELSKANVSARNIEAALSGFREGVHLDLLMQIRVEDDVIFDNALGMLEALKGEFGRWSIDDDSGLILFDNDAVASRYDAHFERLTAAAERQQQLQVQLLTRQQSR